MNSEDEIIALIALILRKIKELTVAESNLFWSNLSKIRHNVWHAFGI